MNLTEIFAARTALTAAILAELPDARVYYFNVRSPISVPAECVRIEDDCFSDGFLLIPEADAVEMF